MGLEGSKRHRIDRMIIVFVDGTTEGWDGNKSVVEDGILSVYTHWNGVAHSRKSWPLVNIKSFHWLSA